MLANVVRVVLILVALLILFVTALYTEGSGGREILLTGLVIDLIAVAVIVGVISSWWRSRRPTPG